MWFTTGNERKWAIIKICTDKFSWRVINVLLTEFLQMHWTWYCLPVQICHIVYDKNITWIVSELKPDPRLVGIVENVYNPHLLQTSYFYLCVWCIPLDVIVYSYRNSICGYFAFVYSGKKVKSTHKISECNAEIFFYFDTYYLWQVYSN